MLKLKQRNEVIHIWSVLHLETVWKDKKEQLIGMKHILQVKAHKKNKCILNYENYYGII